MTVKGRIAAIHLAEKLERNPAYAKQLGVSAGMKAGKQNGQSEV